MMNETAMNGMDAEPVTDVQQQQVLLAEEEEEEDTNMCSERSLWTRIWQGVAGASIALNIAAMAVEGPVITVLMGIIALVVGPIVIARQFQLQNMDSLRQVHNRIRQDINRMAMENCEFNKNNTKLEGVVSNLKTREQELSVLTEKQGTNVEAFVSLVKQNREVIDKQKAYLKAETLQKLATAIINSDSDRSGKFSERELMELEINLMTSTNVEVNYPALRSYMAGSQRNLESVLNLVTHMDDETVPEEERIFQAR